MPLLSLVSLNIGIEAIALGVKIVLAGQRRTVMCSDNVFVTAIKLIFGAVIALMLTNYLPGSFLKSAKIAIEECEKSLPRDQHCIISAIPEELK